MHIVMLLVRFLDYRAVGLTVGSHSILNIYTWVLISTSILLLTRWRVACVLSDPRTKLLPETVRSKSTVWLQGLTKHILSERPVDKRYFIHTCICINVSSTIFKCLSEDCLNSARNCDVKRVMYFANIS